jgi:protein-L-isoaspartate(D-aspartate) O-methyltransferase
VCRSIRLLVAARAIGVRDARVLDAVAVVPRASYVPRARVGEADLDRPIPIGAGQVTTQPSLVAAMVEALALRGGERVLDVGTGLGYQAAILGRFAREVWTVERRPELAAAAAANLAAEGVDNVRVHEGDGSDGLAAHALTTRSSSPPRIRWCRRRCPHSSHPAVGSCSRSEPAAPIT